MTYLDKLQKAKNKLMLEHPYFGTIASSLILEKNNEITTFSSDGKSMFFNSEYIDRLSIKEVEFVMANGAMHTVLQHENRALGRTKWLWQTATDYVVNAMLVKNGMQAPEYANYESKFEGMYAEEIYEILRSEMINNSDSNMEEESQKITEDDNSHESLHLQESKTNTSDELEEFFEQTFQKLNRQGTLPKDIKFVIPKYFSRRIDWREILYGYIASYAKSVYSFSPPNMKHLYRGICLPSLSSDLLRIVIAVDTSGSVEKELLGLFMAEITSIMQQYPSYEIDLISADSKIQSHRVFLPGETLEYELSGGGGTDFRPVFNFIDKNISYPSLLLYFTDANGFFPENKALYDVLWVMPEKKEVPFGEVVVLNSYDT